MSSMDETRDGDDGSSRKRPRAASIVTGADEEEDAEADAAQSAEEPAAEESGEDDERIQTEEIVAQDKDSNAIENGECEEEEDDEEDEVLVVLELTDFKNHPIFDDHRHLTIEGLMSDHPVLRVGEYSLHGQLEETVGTNFFYETSRNHADKPAYQDFISERAMEGAKTTSGASQLLDKDAAKKREEEREDQLKDLYASYRAAHTDLESIDESTFAQYTGLLTAYQRALETSQPDRLIVDPYAEALAGEVGAAFSSLVSKWAPTPDWDVRGMQYMALRTRYLDDALDNRDPSIQQIVILATGLDARAYRLHSLKDAHVWELDVSEAMMERKKRILSEANAKALAKEHHYLIADLAQDHWPQMLLNHGFDPEKPTFWIMEGLLNYLTQSDIIKIIKSIDGHSAPGSVFWTDIMGRAVVDHGVMGNFCLKYGEDDPLKGVLSMVNWDLKIAARLGEPGTHYGRQWTPILSTGEPKVGIPCSFVLGMKPQGDKVPSLP